MNETSPSSLPLNQNLMKNSERMLQQSPGNEDQRLSLLQSLCGIVKSAEKQILEVREREQGIDMREKKEKWLAEIKKVQDWIDQEEKNPIGSVENDRIRAKLRQWSLFTHLGADEIAENIRKIPDGGSIEEATLFSRSLPERVRATLMKLMEEDIDSKAGESLISEYIKDKWVGLQVAVEMYDEEERLFTRQIDWLFEMTKNDPEKKKVVEAVQDRFQRNCRSYVRQSLLWTQENLTHENLDQTTKNIIAAKTTLLNYMGSMKENIERHWLKDARAKIEEEFNAYPESFEAGDSMKNLAIVSDPSWGDVVSIYVYFRPDHSSPWEEQWIMMKRDILTHTDQPGEYQLQAKHFYRLEDGESFDPPLEKIIQVQPSTDPERDRMNTGGFF